MYLKQIINDINSNIYSDINISKINKFNFRNNIFINNLESIEIGQDKSCLKILNEKGEIIKTFFTEDKSLIKCIDLSHDNKYILITCDKYLVIINSDTKIKSEPITLRLSQSSLNEYKIKNDCFTCAKFITNENLEDKMLIANLEDYIIIWNFEKVLKGDINSYRIINVN